MCSGRFWTLWSSPLTKDSWQIRSQILYGNCRMSNNHSFLNVSHQLLVLKDLLHLLSTSFILSILLVLHSHVPSCWNLHLHQPLIRFEVNTTFWRRSTCVIMNCGVKSTGRAIQQHGRPSWWWLVNVILGFLHVEAEATTRVPWCTVLSNKPASGSAMRRFSTKPHKN